ncbi:MAG: hypothetical protein O2894_04675 [Planctomycetota bacterium]|nr:hypothetical protein [Planctomycetota bacterium]
MRALATIALLTFLALLSAQEAHAGGGPETTLVVVNADSPLSWKVANEYARGRRIPATHLCPVTGIPNLLRIDIDFFRDHLWKQIETYITTNGLQEEIDGIAYSVDFPFGVNYAKDFTLGPEDKLNLPPVASLTGVTYLHRLVKLKSKSYLALDVNRYCRLDTGGQLLPGHAFRNGQAWDRQRLPEDASDDPEALHRYMPAVLLGHTGIQGNTTAEILNYLGRGQMCDGRKPTGTVYLMNNKDVRATTRAPQFEKLIEALKAVGGKAVVLTQGEDGQDGKVPQGKDDVLGCVAGIAGFNWPDSKSTMLPGAIAEHLTSFGAQLDGSGQTKITEFLRAGAVGSSGTVAEPYALWQKFPLSSLHVHYREGCSLAESFFQSVAGPYQLLVVGDPLARPFALFAGVELVPPTAKGPWTGTVELRAHLTPAPGTEIAVVEWWLDGQRLGQVAPDAAFALDTTAHPVGEHELRIVAVEGSLVATRSSITQVVEFGTGGAAPTIKGSKKATPWGETLQLSGKAASGVEVVVRSGYRVLATAKRTSSSSWKAEIDTRLLGEGTTTVQAHATSPDGVVALSAFFDVEVGPPEGASKTSRRPKKKKSKAAAPPKAGQGLQATIETDDGAEHELLVATLGDTGKQGFVEAVRAGVKGKLKSIHLEGEIFAEVDGVYRLAILAAGKLAIDVRGSSVFEAEGLVQDKQAYTAVGLKAGWHKIEIDYEPSGDGDLNLWWGGAVVTTPLAGALLRP